MNQKQNNTPSKEPTVMIVGETTNYSVAYYILKMTLNAANKLKHLFLNRCYSQCENKTIQVLHNTNIFI